MGKRKLRLETSAGLKIRQQVALRLLAHFVDKPITSQRDSVSSLANALDAVAQQYAKTPRTGNKALASLVGHRTREELTSYLEQALANAHELQPRVVERIAESSEELKFLSNLSNLRAAALRWELPNCFVLTFVLGALALDWDPTDRYWWFRNEKKRCAEIVIETIWRRWVPRKDRTIHLPELPLSLLSREHARGLRNLGHGSATASHDRNFAACSFRVSPLVSQSYPSGKDKFGLLTYLLQLAFDDEVLHPSVRLRWALDLSALIAATHAWTVCDWGDRGIEENERIRADAVLGTAKLLWGDRGADDWALSIRMMARLQLPNDQERKLRALWGMDALRDATAKLNLLFRDLGIEKQWLWESWTGRVNQEEHHGGNRRLLRTLNWSNRLLSSPRGLQKALSFARGLRFGSRSSTRQRRQESADSTLALSAEDLAQVKAILMASATRAQRVVQRAASERRYMDRRDYERLISIQTRATKAVKCKTKRSRKSKGEPIVPAIATGSQSLATTSP
jgi:hypothetical protein